MNPNKSIGPNSIPTFILKILPNILSKPLCGIINESFKLGVFPKLLKIANVTPVFKKVSGLECRPISLLSNKISKIVEQIMHKNLYNFLDKHNCFYELLFGFRWKHSTSHTRIDTTETIR